MGLWRVTEDDPDSSLYAASADASIVIGYMTRARPSAVVTSCPRREGKDGTRAGGSGKLYSLGW